MSEIRKNDHRLMQVLLAPVISEKATLVADKNEQVVFESRTGCHEAGSEGGCRAAVQG